MAGDKLQQVQCDVPSSFLRDVLTLNTLPAFLAYTLISSNNYSSLWLNKHDLIFGVFQSELYYSVSLTTYTAQRKTSWVKQGQPPKCCNMSALLCEMPYGVSITWGSSAYLKYSVHLCQVHAKQKVTKTFEKNILHRLPHKQIYSRSWKDFK